MESFSLESFMRGHHVSKDIWTPIIGESFQCELEEGNTFDCYAVMMRKDDSVIGHVPRRISAACYLFIRKGGSIFCTVANSRQYSLDLPQGGLEVPCLLKFMGKEQYIRKVRRLLECGFAKLELNDDESKDEEKSDDELNAVTNELPEESHVFLSDDLSDEELATDTNNCHKYGCH